MEEYKISYPTPDTFDAYCCMEAGCGVNIFVGPCEICPACDNRSTWKVFNPTYTIRNMES